MHWCDELGMFSVAKKLWLNHQCHRWCIFQIYWYLQREVQTFLLHGKPSICTCICAICYFSSILMFAITFAAASGLIYCKAYFKTVQEVTRLKCKGTGPGTASEEAAPRARFGPHDHILIKYVIIFSCIGSSVPAVSCCSFTSSKPEEALLRKHLCIFAP